MPRAAVLQILVTLSFGAGLTAGAAPEQAAAPPPSASQDAARTAAFASLSARTGDVHDFDYFAGGWTTRQRRLKARGVGSNEWDEFPATLCMTPYLDGMVTADELHFPTKGWAGLTLRVFDLEKRQWSIYWISSRSGKLQPPVVGGFDGSRGEFYGQDLDDGRAVLVRYMWNKLDRDHARWEQAFSSDGRTWETNWTADFTRADPAATCEAGRPKQRAAAR